jgi:ribosomal-protein-alanine N-acetyltransferase
MRALSRESPDSMRANKPNRTRSAAHAGHVRRARPADAAAIVALEEHFPSDRLSPRSVRRFLAAPQARVWVAELRGAVVGNLILLTRRNSRCARIYSIVVAPAARGLGLGRRLLAAAENEARRLGLAALVLEVRTDNRAARALYGRLGYVQVQRLPGFYGDGADGLRLVKPLRHRALGARPRVPAA